MKWLGLGARARDSRLAMRRYLAASLELAAMPQEAWSPALWQRAADKWWLTAVRAGAHRMPPAILFDLGAVHDRLPVGWRGGDGPLAAYRHGMRQLALLRYHDSGPVADGQALAATLQALWPDAAVGAGLAPPAAIDLEALYALLRELGAGAAVPDSREIAGEPELSSWRTYVVSFMQAVAPQLALDLARPLASEVLHPDGAGARQVASLELELLEQLTPRPPGPMNVRTESSARLPGQLQERRPLGHFRPGVSGVELTDAVERACLWQLGCGRAFLVERMAAHELSAYRPPRTTGRQKTSSCLVAWLDPTSVSPAGPAAQSASYAAGKRLAAELFLELLGLATQLGLAEVALGLISLPVSRPPVLVTPRQARSSGWTPEDDAGENGLGLLPRLPALGEFYSRPAHRPTISQTCTAAGLSGHGLGLVLAKSLLDALAPTAPESGTCVVLLLVPEGAWAALEPLGEPAAAARRVRVQLEALLRPKLAARVAVLAIHDEKGDVRALAEAAEQPRRAASDLLQRMPELHACVRSTMQEVLASAAAVRS